MNAANEITRVVADLSDPYAPLIPTDVDRLGYCGRELQLAAARGHASGLEPAIDAARRTWLRVRVKAAAHDAADTERMDAQMAALGHARTVALVARAADGMLLAVLALQRAFEFVPPM